MDSAGSSQPSAMVSISRPPPAGKTCGVCLDVIGTNTTYTLSSCGHTLHKPCLMDLAKSRLFRGEPVKCYEGENVPGEIACGRPLIDADLLHLLSAQDWTSIQRLRAQRADVALRFCPNANCGAEVRGGSASSPALTCQRCAQTFCWTHATAHPLTSCSEYTSRADVSAEETLSLNAISATAKACPKCAAWVERTGGCNVIVCASCGASFCWLCLLELPAGDECERATTTSTIIHRQHLPQTT